MNPPPDALITEWLEHLRLDRALSPRTLDTYARSLRSFPEAVTATREQAEAWWRARADKALTTRVNELAALHSFYRWAVKFDHLDADPTARIEAPKVPAGQPSPMSRADFLHLLATLEGDMRRAVALGGYAGLRVAEAAELDWSHVDAETRRMRVTGKGRKVRAVAVSAVLLDSLLPDTGGNVVRAGDVPYSAAVLQRKVNRAIRRAGVDGTFHKLRHRYGTVGAPAVPLLTLSRAMGHSSPATTAIYAAMSDSDLDLIADAAAR